MQIPKDPLARFREIYDELHRRRTWTIGVTPLRNSTVALLCTPGRAYDVADRVYQVADVLKKRAGWFGPLVSPIRFSVAAMLVMSGDDPQRFCDDVERAGELFRERSLRRGSIFEVLAILILRGADASRRISATDVDRFAQIHAMMKSHHRWLTGPDDYPACALLTHQVESVHEMARRIENHYEGLRGAGLPAGNPLQLVSHVLYLNPAGDREALRRFLDLHRAFREAGVRMWQSDFDELATLALLDGPAAGIVELVVRHREDLKTLRPHPDPWQSFSLACATACVELLGRQVGSGEPRDPQAVVHFQSLMVAHQAAIAAQNSQAAVGAAG
ncbi:MAG: DUF4003 family protein [Planctomycetota bacterium]